MEIEKELSALKGENARLNSELEVWDWHITELKNASPIKKDSPELDTIKEELAKIQAQLDAEEAKVKESQAKEAIYI